MRLARSDDRFPGVNDDSELWTSARDVGEGVERAQLRHDAGDDEEEQGVGGQSMTAAARAIISFIGVCRR